MDLKGLDICIDRALPEQRLKHHARRTLEINATNLPSGIDPAAMNRMMEIAPQSLAIVIGKRWKPACTLRVAFLDGDTRVQDKVFDVARIWEQHANIRFKRVTSDDAEIRISFRDNGSWSYVGTEAQSVPTSSPTMNFGWLHRETENKEYHRVVLHEFGHALGAIHEHQNPVSILHWNVKKVYEVYCGSPNFWSKEQVDRNILSRYGRTETNSSSFDPTSIMMYQFPKELFIDGHETPMNYEPSELDKRFMAEHYPFSGEPEQAAALASSDLREALLRLDLTQLSPLDAFDALRRLKGEAGGADHGAITLFQQHKARKESHGNGVVEELRR